MRLWPVLATKPPKKSPEPLPDPPVEEGDEEADEPSEEEKRHDHLILAFAYLRKETTHRVDQLTSLLSGGKIDTQEWAAAMRKELTSAHGEAWSIGRKLSGHAGAHSREDTNAGEAAWKRQEEFFSKFLSDIESGRYTKSVTKAKPSGGNEPDKSGADQEAAAGLNEKAVAARARAYEKATRGTVHEAFRVALEDELTDWNLGSAEHCRPSRDYPYYCPGLAEESPKPASEWQTAPCRGDCPCGGNCECYLSTADGKHSTAGI